MDGSGWDGWMGVGWGRVDLCEGGVEGWEAGWKDAKGWDDEREWVGWGEVK